ncbi:putative membrane protein [Bartonella sp. CDC_skunk]|uniref:DUF1254 domain-containing protein n=1 Tax=Bartonella rochalimae ATCC BAA-1498 TaxID=685782 RepID=E6YKS9_9HYPH|nr:MULTISPECIES: hypothetical protein [Bartonella]AQX18694.1 putative membrane protein [Bartonella sp. A1379B]AQX21698.1 putative membrane protein [Bartonella sp. CDC_skunk]AQX26962.1 putative membrane protein [Bartonella sp. Raccoon60]KEC54177.1 hypothetical protein O99_01058 [Bartonella rochalimae ATCC BAA-1498]CBI77467.1 conserved hypothetical protein [Bartonella rochalimae ATCC BAA-1498]
MFKFIHTILLIGTSTIIVHICILLFIPHYTRNNIWTRLEKIGPPYQFADLNSDNPIRQSMDPLFLLKVCKFNLDNGPVHLTTPQTTQFWSLSAYTNDGIIFYNLNDKTAPNAKLNLIIGSPLQITKLKQSKIEHTLHSVLVSQKLNEGFAILRVFTPSLLEKKESESFLAKATCRIFNE